MYLFIKKIIFIIAALCCLQASSLFAQPLNDDCGGAISLTVGTDGACTPVSGDVTGATQSFPACKGTADDDVWFSFTATGSNQIIKVTPSESFDAVIEVFGGSCGTLDAATALTQRIECSNEYLAGKVEILPANNYIAGETYLVRVHHFGAKQPATTTFEICVYSPATPANDDCVNAELLPVNPTCQNRTRSTEGATDSGIPSDCIGGQSDDPNDDVWFKFSAPASGNAIIRVDGSKDFRPVVEVFSSCGSASPLLCKAAAFHNEILKLSLTGLTPGQEYYFRVFEYFTQLTSTLTFEVCVLDPPPPANDDCAGATLLANNVTLWHSGDLHGATASAGPAVCSGDPDDDLWFSFVPASDKQIVKIMPSSGFDAVVQVLDGCEGNVIACKDDSTMGDLEVFTLSGLTASQPYYLRIFSKITGVPPTSSFEVSTYSPVVNDECEGAVTLTVSPAPTPVDGTVEGATRSMNACSGEWFTAEDDVWFKFIASASDNSITVKGSPGFDAAVELLDACGGVSLACVNDSAAGQDEKISPAGLVGGNTYYVRVYDANAEEASTKTFTVTATGLVLQSTLKPMVESTLQVYPVPADNVLHINFTVPGSDVTVIKLLSTDGRMAYTSSPSGTSGDVSERIDISRLTKGIYLLQIQIGEEVVSKKIVVN